MSVPIPFLLQPASPRWGRGVTFSLAAHALLAAAAMLHFSAPADPDAAPAAVMQAYAPQFQVSLIQPKAPVGVSQQQRVEAAKAEPEAAANSPKLALAEAGEWQQQKNEPGQRKPQPKTPRKPVKTASQRQQAQEGNALNNSQAAPPVQTLAAITAAPLASDAAQRQQLLNWESLVKGRINQVKAFPPDARRRGRSGVAQVRFEVDERGALRTSQLVNSSGTLSLDREALAVLSRAMPYPPPPAALLRGGRYIVTLPVSFNLNGH